jgi:hypothetical protein
VDDDPFLDSIPNGGERLLLARGFVLHCRAFDFDRQGQVTTERPRPVVSSSLRDAISCVASAFRECGRSSPFHLTNGVYDAGSIHPRIRALLKGFESIDPNVKRQKAVTPILLKDLALLAQTMPKWAQHTAQLIMGGYFFAMRACEFCLTERPGKTRRLTTGNIVFRDAESKPVEHDDPRLRHKAMFVTVCFVNQKNGTKMEKRSQRRSMVAGLCPVEAWTSVIERLRQDFPFDERWKSRTVCSYMDGQREAEIQTSHVLNLLQMTCRVNDGKNKYGIDVSEIGTRSIRSGAAMSLAVQGGNSDKKIMMLGRWKSMAFLAYIRPQVMEWAGDMASEMAKAKPFLDLGERETSKPKRQQTPTKQDTDEEEFPKFTPFGL